VPDVDVQPISHRSLVALRIDPRQAREAIERLQLAAPLTRNAADPASAWMGPNHWLLMSESQGAESVIQSMAAALGGIVHNATCSTDEFDAISIGGPLARDVLASGCGLDLRHDRFPPGSCRRTRFARIPVAICALDEAVFELIYDRTYRDYLRSWITDSISTSAFQAPVLSARTWGKI
jgi:sarcosine oxidase subunit gamma